ncbi:MAG: SH3 domain-containing protein [Clostridium perfringens]|nr:SH3 domain-containing protein [Clostridium perfringens]
MVKNKAKTLFLLCTIGTCIVLQGLSYSNPTSKTIENKTVLSSSTSDCETGLVTASVLNVRSDSSATSSIVGSLARGTKVDVVYRESNGWYMIKFGSKYAYVNGNYISIINSNSLPIIQTSKVIASKLNVRSGSSTSNEIIGTLKKGDLVEIVSKENGWYKIKFYNSYGYVSASYVK